MPRLILPAVSSVALLAAGCVTIGALQSVTFIEPGKAFLLGGGQTSAFAVQGRNTGGVPVIVYLEQGGRRDSLATLRPGQPIDAEFPAQTIAVFRNTSDTRGAEMTLTARGATSNLGMRYEANAR